MLTERERVALERYRSREFHYADVECDRQALALAMLRLYPLGWNDPVTPERLVELGFSEDPHNGIFTSIGKNATIQFWSKDNEWYLSDSRDVTRVPHCQKPRNMYRVHQLLTDCGAIKEEK